MGSQVGRDSDKFMLRLPDGMREAIKAAADANSRSMNAEISARLAESLGEGHKPGIQLAIFVNSTEEKLQSATMLELFAHHLRREAARSTDDETEDPHPANILQTKLKR